MKNTLTRLFGPLLAPLAVVGMLLGLAAAPRMLDAATRGVGFSIGGCLTGTGSTASPIRFDATCAATFAGITNSGAELATGVISPTALTGGTTYDNYAPPGFSGAWLVRQDATGGPGSPATLAGLAGGVAGRRVLLVNISSDGTYLVISPEALTSTAANRFTTVSASTGLQLSPGGAAWIEWDPAPTSRWRPIGFSSDYTMATKAGAFSTAGLLSSSAGSFGGANSFTNVITPTALGAGTTNDHNPTGIGTATTVRQDVSASGAILTGIVATTVSAPADGRLLFVQNISATNPLTLKHDQSSTAAYRFFLPNATDWIIPPLGSVIFRYTTTSNRWVLLAGTLASNGNFPTSLQTNGDLTIGSTGHVRGTGTTPTLSTCGSSPAPTIVGNDNWFRVVTGGSGTACTINFATAATTNPPICIQTREGAAALPACTPGLSSLVCGSMVATTTYGFHCFFPN